MENGKGLLDILIITNDNKYNFETHLTAASTNLCRKVS